MDSFPYINRTVSVQAYTFVSVNRRRNNEARAPFRLKYGKLAIKYPWIYEYFYSEA